MWRAFVVLRTTPLYNMDAYTCLFVLRCIMGRVAKADSMAGPRRILCIAIALLPALMSLNWICFNMDDSVWQGCHDCIYTIYESALHVDAV